MRVGARAGTGTVESPLMLDLRLRSFRPCGLLRPCALLVACGALCLAANAQQERHGRGYKAPPPTATVQITVEKAANEKPLANASVIFRAVRNDEMSGNLEMKTDPDGHASIDLLEVGSHITVQVIAGGYATYASDFDLTSDGKQLLVKMQRPRAQVSVYGEDRDRPAEVQPGVQEKPRAAQPGTGSTRTPATGNTQAPGTGNTQAPATTAPGAPSSTVPGNATTPSVPGSPQSTLPGSPQ